MDLDREQLKLKYKQLHGGQERETGKLKDAL